MIKFYISSVYVNGNKFKRDEQSSIFMPTLNDSTEKVSNGFREQRCSWFPLVMEIRDISYESAHNISITDLVLTKFVSNGLQNSTRRQQLITIYWIAAM